MKGLVVTPAYYPDKSKGGSITGCRSFAKAIANKHTIEIITLDTTNQGERVLEVDNIKVSYFKVTRGLEWLSKSGWGFSIRFSLWFIRNLKYYDYIYIRSLWNYISIFSALACMFYGKKYGISSSGKFSKYALKSSYLKKLILLPLVLLIIKKSTFIHFPSISEYNSTPTYLSQLSSPIILSTAINIKNRINEEMPPFKKLKRRLIYTVSRFDEIKRIELIANISNKLESNFDIIHIGDYKNNPKYFKKIEEIYKNKRSKILYDFSYLKDLNSYENRVFFPGYLEIEEVDELIKKYQDAIFIQMSYSEGQSNSILEAMARGSLCIVSEGCNMQKANDLKSIIISNEENLLREINKLLSEDFKVGELRDNQYKFLKNFHSFEKISNQFDQKLKKLL